VGCSASGRRRRRRIILSPSERFSWPVFLKVNETASHDFRNMVFEFTP
jgi:hypothetical protein